ncbi:MAG: RNA polymerase factor sigma-54 [Gammaproteobacteria bacterium]|nr:RNA polymerase factor sigma-54 [Gammaproteobacteria bacterium]
MKQALELKLGQRLTMTPQLQQAIRLLQLSATELQIEIQQALEGNLLLQEGAEDDVLDDSPPDPEDGPADPHNGEDDAIAELDLQLSSEPMDSNIDSEWAERFEFPTNAVVRDQDVDINFEIDARNSRPATLHDYLDWQMRMAPLSPTDRQIAQSLIESVSPDGYLTCSLVELQQTLAREIETDIDEIEAVLHRIQNFDPPGVGARNLSECLLIQLKHKNPSTPFLESARALAADYLQLLANCDYIRLRSALGISSDELKEVIALIQSLDPRPGSRIEPMQPLYVIPDVTVKKVKNKWRADLNWDTYPELRINRKYQALIRRAANNGENKFLQEQLQEARWFINSIKNRNDTLLKVSQEIVNRQQEFFEHGEEAMQPLVLHDIAEAVDMHESTVSRATTQKFMVTPRGVFELRYFFSSRVGTVDGESYSATAIKSLIKKLVENEAPTKPISDSKIMKILEQKGIQVARRTIAKYRDHLNIPPSNQRKSLS